MRFNLKFFSGIIPFAALSAVASVLSFCFMLVAVRYLGFKEYGLLVLFIAVCLTINGFSSSQSWQGASRYFARGFKFKGSERVFFSLILTDIVNVLIAITVTYISLYFFNDIFLFPNAEILIILLIAPKLISFPLGLVRVLDHFIFLGCNMILTQGLKLVGLLYLIFLSENPLEVIDIIILYIATEWLFLIFNVCKVAWDFRFRKFLFSVMGFNYNSSYIEPDVIKFQAICHANATSVLSIRQVDEIIVGIYLSVEILGFWKLLKIFAGIIGKIVEPLYVFVFPKLETMDIRRKDHKFALSILNASRNYFIVSSAVTVIVIISVIVFKDNINYSLDNIFAGIFIIWISALNLIYFFSHPLALRCRGEKKILLLNLISGFVFLVLLFTIVQTQLLSMVALILAVYTSINHFGRLYIAKSYMSS